MLATELSNYYAEVKKHLDCPQQEKERLLCEANRLLLELQADDPFLDYDKIAGFFGEPKEFADFLMQSVDEKVIASYERRRLIRKCLMRILVVCLAVAVVWYVYYTKYPSVLNQKLRKKRHLVFMTKESHNEYSN